MSKVCCPVCEKTTQDLMRLLVTYKRPYAFMGYGIKWVYFIPSVILGASHEQFKIF